MTGGNIVINSGTITARGYPSQWGAGIGTGASYSSNVVMGDITINGGTVTAIGGNDGSAGIGTTYTYVGSGGSTIGNITINGGTVIATGNANATAIGTGYTASGVTGRVGEITINGGTVTATCGGSGPTVIGQGTNGTCGDIYIAMGSSIPTLTLNNPHISGTPIEVLNFLNAGSGQSVITPDMYGLENIAFDNTDYWFESFSGYRFGCLTEQQFRFEPLN